MPYTIEWGPDWVIWAFYGVLSNHDAIQANLDIYGDPRFDDLRYQIVDISGVELFDVSDDSLQESASMDQAASLTNTHLCVAVVAPNETANKVAECYKSAMTDSRWKVEIFNTIEDSMNWVHSEA